MKCLIVLFAVAAVSSAQYYPFAPVPTPLRTQYHAQNELGDYSFGYSGGPSSKQESKVGGATQGSFSYVDAYGLVQSRSYAADPVNGFRVAGTDIPVDANTPLVAPIAHPVTVLGRRKRSAILPAHVAYSPGPLAYAASPFAYAASPVYYNPALPADTPEVAAAKVAHYHQYNYEAHRNAFAVRRKRSAGYAYAAPLASPYTIAAPGVVSPTLYHAAPTVYHAAAVAAPSVYAAPVVPAPAVYSAPVAAPVAVAPAVSSQYHSQDELGQYSYGYSNPSSSKTETRFANGVTQGGYSYVDAHGLVQSASYVSDPAHGFRVAATNLPAAPIA